MYVHILTFTTGNYNNEDILQLSDIQTCVSKDLRPKFETHDVLEISWTPHRNHGMCSLIITFIIMLLSKSEYTQ